MSLHYFVYSSQQLSEEDSITVTFSGEKRTLRGVILFAHGNTVCQWWNRDLSSGQPAIKPIFFPE